MTEVGRWEGDVVLERSRLCGWVFMCRAGDGREGEAVERGSLISEGVLPGTRRAVLTHRRDWCVCVCVYACVCGWVCVCVCVCVGVCVDG